MDLTFCPPAPGNLPFCGQRSAQKGSLHVPGVGKAETKQEAGSCYIIDALKESQSRKSALRICLSFSDITQLYPRDRLPKDIHQKRLGLICYSYLFLRLIYDDHRAVLCFKQQ